MSDKTNAFGHGPSEADGPPAVGPAGIGIPDDAPLAAEVDDIIQMLEERLTVAKRRKSTGSLRVGTRTEIVDAIAEVELDRYRVEVTHVSVGRIVDEVPSARAEGDTTIVPVVEERFVVVKQLFLVEELRIRHVLEREVVSEPVTLRRQRAVIERLDPHHRTELDETISAQETKPGVRSGRHRSVE